MAKVQSFAGQAAEAGAEIVAFPECCLTGYWHLRGLARDQLVDLAESVPDGPSSKTLLALSEQHNLTIGAGLIELADDGQLYNTYVVAMPDGQVQRHRKIHCFVNPHVASGSQFTVFDTPHGCKVGVLICYDNNIGENVRLTAMAGADILLAPHQTGGCNTASPLCMGLVDRKLWDNRHDNPAAIEAEFKGPKGRGWLIKWLPARAHDNGVFLIFSNGVGQDGGEIRTGNAMIMDCYGNILSETWKAGDEMILADLDASLRGSSTGERWIRTRRPELYGLLAEATGLEEDVKKVRFEHEQNRGDTKV